MPFRGVTKELVFGKPVKMFTAASDDLDVQIGITPYGATGTSPGPNFIVGGPDIGTEGGFVVTSNEYSTNLSEGDEIWVAAVEALPFADKVRITATIRSGPAHLTVRHIGSVPPLGQHEGDA